MVGRSGQGEGSQAWQGNQGMIGMIGHVMTVILARLHYQMCAQKGGLKLNLFFTYLCKMVELYVCLHNHDALFVYSGMCMCVFKFNVHMFICTHNIGKVHACVHPRVFEVYCAHNYVTRECVDAYLFVCVRWHVHVCVYICDNVQAAAWWNAVVVRSECSRAWKGVYGSPICQSQAAAWFDAVVVRVNAAELGKVYIPRYLPISGCSMV